MSGQKTEEQFRRLVESVKDHAIFLLDARGHISTWNAGAQNIKGYTPEEILGKDISLFYTPEDRAAGRPKTLLGRATAEGHVEDEGWRVRKDGQRFWANVVISAIVDDAGKLTGFSKVTRDLTERVRSEQDRLRAAQVEEAMRLKDEFLSIAAHELRTPLTALLMQLHLLSTHSKGLAGVARERVAKAQKSGARLSKLIEALLDVSQFATGQMHVNREPLNLVGVAAELIHQLKDAAQATGNTLSLSPSVARIDGEWDRTRIEQVLSNLISNAMKYAPGTPIDVSVRLEGTTAVMQVEDHGAGLKGDDHSRIFERFERASASSLGGLGLGLYIVRAIVVAHHGTVSAENRPDGGARFTVRLPLR